MAAKFFGGPPTSAAPAPPKAVALTPGGPPPSTPAPPPPSAGPSEQQKALFAAVDKLLDKNLSEKDIAGGAPVIVAVSLLCASNIRSPPSHARCGRRD